MMSALSIQLTKGCKETDLDPHQRELFRKLRDQGILEKHNGLWRLSSLYRIGKITFDQDGRGYIEAQHKGQQDLAIAPHHIGDAKPYDTVLVRRTIARRGRAVGKVLEVLERARDYIVAYTYRNENGHFEVRDFKTALPITARMEGMDLKAFKIGTVLKIDALSEEAVEVIGHLDDPKVDETVSLILHNRRDRFPPEAIEEALRIEQAIDPSRYPDRKDLRSLDFCTIDPVSAKDFDDAIYFDTDTHTLYVAIADVSRYVPYFSEIDKEAKRRGFTTYFPHKAIPMLPRELSENICSLKPSVDRLAFVCEIALDPKTLTPLQERFYEAVIHSKYRFDYDKVDTIFEHGYSGGDATVKKILTWLLPLRKITQTLRQERLKKGFDFRSDEVRLTLDSAHRLIDTRIETSTPSHSLIEECMLLANKAAAKRFTGEGDAIFRIHEPPELSKLESLLSELATVGLYVESYEDAPDLIRAIQKEARKLGIEKEVDARIIQSLKQASYSPFNVGHFGLGFKRYSHFTSPIRRYSDLILHRLIKAQLQDDKEEEAYLLRNIEALCVKVSDLERESARCEWDFRDRKFARWAKENLGKTFRAQVNEAAQNGTTTAVLTDPVAPEGLLVTLQGNSFTVFDTIVVELTEANIAHKTILGRVCDTLAEKPTEP